MHQIHDEDFDLSITFSYKGDFLDFLMKLFWFT